MPRSARIDDQFADEEIIEVIYSPDGEVVLFVRRRSKLSLPPAAQSDFALDELADDIWVQEGTDTPRNLTNGADDVSGAWAPQWSPDGRRLAFLSSRGGNIKLWQWERGKGGISKISDVPIRSRAKDTPPFYWLNGREIVCLSPPDGEPSRPENPRPAGAVRRPTEAWAKAMRGEATGSVVDSTTYHLEDARVVVLDVTTGAQRQISRTSLERYGPLDWWLSPSKQAIVLRSPQVMQYPGSIRSRMGWPTEVAIHRLGGTHRPPLRALPHAVHAKSIKWTPDGKELIFFANGDRPVNPVILFGSAAAEVIPDRKDVPVENPATLYRLNLETGALREIETGEMDLGQLGAPDFQVMESGDLLFSAPRRRYGVLTGPPASRGPAWGSGERTARPILPQTPKEWWLVSRGGGVRNLTEAESKALQPEASEAVIRRKFQQATKKPAPNAQLIAVSPKRDSGIYRSVYGFSTTDRLWRVSASGKSRLLMTLNGYRNSVRPRGKDSTRFIEYTSLNGEKLWAKIELPDGDQANRRYPVVVLQYPGALVKPDSPKQAEGAASTLPRPECLAGFVFMTASVPQNLPGMGSQFQGDQAIGSEEGESLFAPVNGVLPAVQKLIDLGIADPDRIVVEGASNGGGGALALAVQTTRFKAIVAEASTNWGALFNRYTGLNRAFWDRYLDSPSDGVMANSPNRYLPTDLPWWRDGRRERNNLLRYADRVQTPIMLMHGDMDDHPLDASQDFFNALVSMRKPAQFVRYWGAEHNFRRSPANYRDYMQRKLAWYDRWCDIARDEKGDMIWDGDRVKGRNGAPPLEPAAYAKFDLFQPSLARQESAARAVTQQ